MLALKFQRSIAHDKYLPLKSANNGSVTIFAISEQC